MTTLSSNNNGKVLKTSNRGYSVKKTYETLLAFLKENKVDFSVEFAKTGSIYLSFENDKISYSLRISNHSKRNTSANFEIDTEIFVKKSMAYIDFFNKDLGEEEVFSCDFEILNSETRTIFLNHLNKR